MKRNPFLKIAAIAAVTFALALVPQGAFAQRGGHGGGGFHGGGFHGGSVGAFHGGSFGGFRGGNFGGFRGPGFGGFRGGFGFRGGYFGYPWYGFGLGFGLGFGFGPYWGGWGYPYYYGSPWWGPYAYSYPYAYPYSYPYSYSYPGSDPGPYYGRESRNSGCDYRYSDRCPSDGQNGGPRNAPRPNGQVPPAKPSNAPMPQNSPGQIVSNDGPDYRLVSSAENRLAESSTASNFRLADSRTQSSAELRPAVRNVISALRAMPPQARAQQLNSGRYRTLSPSERELLYNVSQLPQEE